MDAEGWATIEGFFGNATNVVGLRILLADATRWAEFIGPTFAPGADTSSTPEPEEVVPGRDSTSEETAARLSRAAGEGKKQRDLRG